MPQPEIIATLLAWCSANGIWIDPRLEVVYTPVSSLEWTRGISVFSKDFISTNETLVKIPKSSVLSHRSCAAATLIAECSPPSDNPHLTLSLALLSELRLGKSSRWWGYLQSLPKETVPTALFWPSECEERKWLRGTEAERILREDIADVVPQIERYYHSVVREVLSAETTLDEYKYAYSLVSSRAFLVDAYHSAALVPIADAFNHIEANHVHIETDYHVCPVCGSLSACPHDSSSSPTIPTSFPPSEDTCDMVSNSPIPPATEVFNTYDDKKKLSNGYLLVHYGFVEDGCEGEMVEWRMSNFEVDEERLELWTKLVKFFGDGEEEWEGVYWPDPWESLPLYAEYEPDVDVDQIVQDPQKRRRPEDLLNVNADGDVSVQLWLLLLVIFCLPRSFDGVDLTFVRRVGKGLQDDVRRHVDEKIRDICEVKVRGMHKSELSIEEWGDILDHADTTPRIKLAIGYAINQRSILEAAMSGRE